MAVLSTINCQSCGHEKSVMHPANEPAKICGECKQKEVVARREAYIKEFLGLRTEEQNRRIAAFMYDTRDKLGSFAQVADMHTKLG